MVNDIVFVINNFILWYFIWISSIYLILLVASIPDILFRYQEVEICNISSLIKFHSFPPVTIIISAYNEENYIIDTILSIISSIYPNTYILIINDGSTDQTLSKLINRFNLYKVDPFIRQVVKTKGNIKGYYVSNEYYYLSVIDKEHIDKSDSLNMGLNATRSPLIMTIDADTLLEPDTISRIVYYMLSKSYTVAVGGSVYILNGSTYHNGKIKTKNISKNPLVVFQVCEYLRSFLFNRSGWNKLGGALCYSGTCTLFMHHAVVDAGGFEPGNTAQDFEIITQLHEHQLEQNNEYNIGYSPASMVWTDVPDNLKDFWRQRYNWQYYSLHSLIKHKKMLFNPTYKWIGFFTYPFFLFGEILGALVECVAYLSILITWGLGVIDFRWALLFFIICIGFSMLLTISTVLINTITFKEYKNIKELGWIFICSIIENFGFRQFHMICRTYATLVFIKDKLMGSDLPLTQRQR